MRWSLPFLPMLVISGKSLIIANITVVNEDDVLLSNANGWKINVSLVRSINSSMHSSIEVEVENGVIRPAILAAPMYADKPASDYSWRLQVHVHKGDGAFTLLLPPNRNVLVLDVAPFVYQVAPGSLSFAGSSAVTLRAGFILTLPIPKYAFAVDVQLPSVRNDTCRFVSRGAALTDIMIKSNRTINSER